MKKIVIFGLIILVCGCTIKQILFKKERYMLFFPSLLSVNKIKHTEITDEKKGSCNWGNEKYEIKLYKNYDLVDSNFVGGTPPSNDTLEIYHTKYSVNHLFNAQQNIDTHIVSAYSFILDNNHYYLLSLGNKSESCMLCEYLLLLFEVSNNSTYCIYKGISYSEDFEYVGDFNNDKQLDILDFKGDTVKILTIKDKKVTPLKGDYLVLHTTTDLETYINLEKSHWFFDLAKEYPAKVIYLEDKK